MAHTSIAPQAFVKGIHTGLQFHPEVTARIVHQWIETASARGNLATVEREAVVDALDGHVQDSAANARLVFDGYLRRTRLLPSD